MAIVPGLVNGWTPGVEPRKFLLTVAGGQCVMIIADPEEVREFLSVSEGVSLTDCGPALNPPVGRPPDWLVHRPDWATGRCNCGECHNCKDAIRASRRR